MRRPHGMLTHDAIAEHQTFFGLRVITACHFQLFAPFRFFLTSSSQHLNTSVLQPKGFARTLPGLQVIRKIEALS